MPNEIKVERQNDGFLVRIPDHAPVTVNTEADLLLALNMAAGWGVKIGQHRQDRGEGKRPVSKDYPMYGH